PGWRSTVGGANEQVRLSALAGMRRRGEKLECREEAPRPVWANRGAEWLGRLACGLGSKSLPVFSCGRRCLPARCAVAGGGGQGQAPQAEGCIDAAEQDEQGRGAKDGIKRAKGDAGDGGRETAEHGAREVARERDGDQRSGSDSRLEDCRDTAE